MGSRRLSPTAPGRPDPKQLTRLWEGTAGGPLPRPSLAKGEANAQDRLTQHSKGSEKGPQTRGGWVELAT